LERLILYGRVATRTRLITAPDLEHLSIYLRSGRGLPDNEMAQSSFPLRQRVDFDPKTRPGYEMEGSGG